VRWNLKMLQEGRPLHRAPVTGEVWHLPESEPFANASFQYRSSTRGQRRPLIVKLPDETELNLDAATAADGSGYAVSMPGDVGTLTVDGLVRGRAGWQGYITGGALVDRAEQERAAQQPLQPAQQPASDVKQPAPAPSTPTGSAG
jgi:hypothetical protein